MTTEKDGDGRVDIHLTLHSTPELVTQALRDIRGAIEAAQPVPPPDGGWELILAEVLNNVVEHAYDQRPDGEIQLELRFDGEALTADIVDFGAPMPNDVPPPGHEQRLDVPIADLPEGGFGWFLIRSMTTRLEYERKQGANCLHLEMPLVQDTCKPQ